MSVQQTPRPLPHSSPVLGRAAPALVCVWRGSSSWVMPALGRYEMEESCWQLGRVEGRRKDRLQGLTSMRHSPWVLGISSEESRSSLLGLTCMGAPSCLRFSSSFWVPVPTLFCPYRFQPCSFSEEPSRQEDNTGHPEGGNPTPGPSLMGLQA